MTAASCALAAAFPPASAALAGGTGAATGGGTASARRYGRHYVVDGWVLTAHDIEALAIREGPHRAG